MWMLPFAKFDFQVVKFEVSLTPFLFNFELPRGKLSFPLVEGVNKRKRETLESTNCKNHKKDVYVYLIIFSIGMLLFLCLSTVEAAPCSFPALGWCMIAIWNQL